MQLLQRNQEQVRLFIHILHFVQHLHVLNQSIKSVHYVIGGAGVTEIPVALHRTFEQMNLQNLLSELVVKVKQFF